MIYFYNNYNYDLSISQINTPNALQTNYIQYTYTYMLVIDMDDIQHIRFLKILRRGNKTLMQNIQHISIGTKSTECVIGMQRTKLCVFWYQGFIQSFDTVCHSLSSFHHSVSPFLSFFSPAFSSAVRGPAVLRTHVPWRKDRQTHRWVGREDRQCLFEA